MAGKHPKARLGNTVCVRGLPVSFTFWPEAYIERGRLITSDPWSCIRANIHQKIGNSSKRNLAIAFLEQAQDFHHAAKEAPRMGSKPLLHYYSFMNLVKVYLILRTNLDLKKCAHGLEEPADNVRKRLTIGSQIVKVSDESSKRVQLYREFIKECGFPAAIKPKPTKVIELLEQIVGIHRITSHTLKKSRQYFPINDIKFEYDPQAKEVWIALYIDKGEVGTAALDIRKHSISFTEVTSPNNNQRRYESQPVRYYRSPIDVMKQLVHSTWKDIWSELRPSGYKFWFSAIHNQKRRAQLASGYQAMFYFGSISRYRPDDFYKLAEGKHGWMVQEFINTQPIQFIYFLGSGIVNAEMVVPELT